jgi:hypothetical protein
VSVVEREGEREGEKRKEIHRVYQSFTLQRATCSALSSLRYGGVSRHGRRSYPHSRPVLVSVYVMLLSFSRFPHLFLPPLPPSPNATQPTAQASKPPTPQRPRASRTPRRQAHRADSLRFPHRLQISAVEEAAPLLLLLLLPCPRQSGSAPVSCSHWRVASRANASARGYSRRRRRRGSARGRRGLSCGLRARVFCSGWEARVCGARWGPRPRLRLRSCLWVCFARRRRCCGACRAVASCGLGGRGGSVLRRPTPRGADRFRLHRHKMGQSFVLLLGFVAAGGC